MRVKHYQSKGNSKLEKFYRFALGTFLFLALSVVMHPINRAVHLPEVGYASAQTLLPYLDGLEGKLGNTPTTAPNQYDLVLEGAKIDPADFVAVNYIVSHESGWCPWKTEGEIGYCPSYHGNPGGTEGVGYGLCQSTPASKMAEAGSDWTTNPVTQLKWCSAYARARYGGWQQAAVAWQNQHWW